MFASTLLLFASLLFLAAQASDIDWTAKNVLPPVRNQGLCGSSSMFAVLDALESALAIQQQYPSALSLQQLRDCASPGDPCLVKPYPPQQLLDYISKRGLCAERDYPTGVKRGTCRDRSCTPTLRPGTKWQMVTVDNESALAAALAKQPVIVALNAQPLTNYTGGVFAGTCSPKLDEVMLLVGDGQAFWKIRASWGASWGMNGYGKLRRGAGGSGSCGIATQPFYPQISVTSASVVV